MNPPAHPSSQRLLVGIKVFVVGGEELGRRWNTEWLLLLLLSRADGQRVWVKIRVIFNVNLVILREEILGRHVEVAAGAASTDWSELQVTRGDTWCGVGHASSGSGWCAVVDWWLLSGSVGVW